MVAKIESKIDAGNGVEQMWRKESLRLSEFPRPVARKGVRGEVNLPPGGMDRKKGRKEERKKESKKVRR